jgi:hypothetical protein
VMHMVHTPAAILTPRVLLGSLFAAPPHPAPEPMAASPAPVEAGRSALD